jgi:hypothetical protein
VLQNQFLFSLVEFIPFLDVGLPLFLLYDLNELLKPPNVHLQVNDRFKLDWGTYLTTSEQIIYGLIDGRGSGYKVSGLLIIINGCSLHIFFIRSTVQHTELSHCNLFLFGIGLFLTRAYTVSGILFETVCCSLYSFFCVPDKENYDGK